MNAADQDTQRVFFALPAKIADDVAIEQVNESLARNGASLKIVPPKNYHITLKFLGPVDRITCSDIMKAFETLRIDDAPVPFTLEGLGAFPDLRRATVIWYGIHADRERISQIQKKIEGLTGSYGFSEEKRQFAPHLTIARIKKNARISDDLALFIKDHAAIRFGASVFDTVVLFESKLTSQGPIYTPLATKKLKEEQTNGAPD